MFWGPGTDLWGHFSGLADALAWISAYSSPASIADTRLCLALVTLLCLVMHLRALAVADGLWVSRRASRSSRRHHWIGRFPARAEIGSVRTWRLCSALTLTTYASTGLRAGTASTAVPGICACTALVLLLAGLLKSLVGR